MAKNNEIIKWHGQVGKTLVGYKLRGEHIIRAYACSVHNPDTPAQQETRAKFSFVTKLIHKIGQCYKTGYKGVDESRSERGMFFSNLWDDAVTGNMNDGYTVDYEKVKIARGLLLPTFAMTCSVIGAQHKVSLSWTSNAGQGDAEATDQLCVNLYNVTKGVSMFTDNGATRQTEALQVQYPTAWAGDTVYVHIFWKKPDASYCSDSQMISFFVAE